jgi:hypothetical protein
LLRPSTTSLLVNFRSYFVLALIFFMALIL